MSLHRNIAVAAFAAALGLSAPMVAGNPALAQTASSETYDSRTLDAFANAAQDVRSVVDEHSAKMGTVTSNEERAKLESAMNDKMIEAIEATPGISLEQYVEIVRAAQEDEALYNRISSRMGDS